MLVVINGLVQIINILRASPTTPNCYSQNNSLGAKVKKSHSNRSWSVLPIYLLSQNQSPVVQIWDQVTTPLSMVFVISYAQKSCVLFWNLLPDALWHQPLTFGPDIRCRRCPAFALDAPPPPSHLYCHVCWPRVVHAATEEQWHRRRARVIDVNSVFEQHRFVMFFGTIAKCMQLIIHMLLHHILRTCIRCKTPTHSSITSQSRCSTRRPAAQQLTKRLTS